MKKENNKPPKDSFSDKSDIEIIYECGRLNLTVDKTLMILRKRVFPERLIEIKEAFKNPGSHEYRSYMDGYAVGEYEMADALRSGVVNHEKDGYKSMNAERRRTAINDALQRNFGIGEID